MSKITTYKKGIWAETLASLYYRFKFYQILETRYKTPVGEIDLIVKRGRSIAFVEVKWRQTKSAAAEAIHQKNQTRVRRAAERYLQKHPECAEMSLRFDALLLSPYQWPEQIKAAWI